MNTTKSSVRFTINFFEHQIIGTKASFNKAEKGVGAEYEELAAKIAAHPTFSLVVKEQDHKTTKAKRTYHGLDFTFMEAYIATLDNAATVKKEYEKAKALAEQSKLSVYPITKQWFLKKFGSEEHPFNMDEAKEAIANHRLKLIEASVKDDAENTDQMKKAG